MIYLNMRVRCDANRAPALYDFIKTDPEGMQGRRLSKKGDSDPRSNREQIQEEIQQAIERRIGPDARLVQVCGTYGSPEVFLCYLVSVGVVGAYKFVKDYPDVRKGIKELSADIMAIVKKVCGDNTDISVRFPPEIGESIDRIDSTG